MVALFSPGAANALDELDADPANDRLVDAIWDVVDLVSERPNSAEARRRALRTPKGHSVWLVPIPYRRSDTWVLLWQTRGEDALIAYIGPDDFRPWRNRS